MSTLQEPLYRSLLKHQKTELEMFGLDPGSTKTFLIHWILCMSHDLPETAMYSFGAN